MKQIAEHKFRSHIYREYSATPVPEPLGMADNTMILYISEDGLQGSIEWQIDYDNGDGDDVGIGLWFADDKKTLQDYDGVFSLNDEAIEFLESLGYDCSYAKD